MSDATIPWQAIPLAPYGAVLHVPVGWEALPPRPDNGPEIVRATGGRGRTLIVFKMPVALGTSAAPDDMATGGRLPKRQADFSATSAGDATLAFQVRRLSPSRKGEDPHGSTKALGGRGRRRRRDGPRLGSRRSNTGSGVNRRGLDRRPRPISPGTGGCRSRPGQPGRSAQPLPADLCEQPGHLRPARPGFAADERPGRLDPAAHVRPVRNRLVRGRRDRGSAGTNTGG